MSQRYYSHYEPHMQKCAEFEAEKNFASPMAARAALEKVKKEKERICEGHVHDNPVCPCLFFSDVESALRHAALGSPDPWAAVYAKRHERKMHAQLRRGRNLAARMHQSLHTDVAARIAGTWLGKAYKHYLG